jgi:hypothetical protein
MNFPHAIAQIAEIHQQLAKGEIYRGYRSGPVAASGAAGVLAAALQPAAAATDPVMYVEYWMGVAALAGTIGLSEVAYNYVLRDRPADRRRTRQVLGQFFPAAAAGLLLTVGLMRVSAHLAPLLPGLWALCFALGTVASRPYLPKLASLVGLYYFAAGGALLWTTDLAAPLAGWRTGLTFGAGQILAATILYLELETPADRPGGAALSRRPHAS